MANSYIVIPGTNIRLYPDDIVTISNKPKTKWVVHTGWYRYQGTQSFGWYFQSMTTGENIPVAIVDLTLCTLVSSKTQGSTFHDGPETLYTSAFTDYDAEVLSRTFISVDTLTQRDNIDPDGLTDGRIVRVNDVGGEVKYYAWNNSNRVWEDADLGGGEGGIPEKRGTAEKPVVLSSLDEGLYRVKGYYQVTPGSDIYLTDIDHLVLSAGDHIKVITEDDMTDYVVAEGQITSSDRYATGSSVTAIISEIISELQASGIKYTAPASGAAAGTHNVQEALDALNDAIGGGDKEIFYGTTEYWNNQPQYISIRGCLYVYSDHTTDSEGKIIAGIKVGDGVSYLIDMPFVDEKYAEHILNTDIHVSVADRAFWNGKVSCHIDPTDTQRVIFTTD